MYSFPDETVENAVQKANNIIQEAASSKQEWIEGYSTTKMVVVPIDILHTLLCVSWSALNEQKAKDNRHTNGENERV